MLLRKGREHRQRRELRHADHRRQYRVHALVAKDVLHIVHGKASRRAVTHHEQSHGERRPHELVVLEKHGEHLPEARTLLLLEAGPVLLHAEEREALEAQHRHRHGHSHDEPAVRRVAQRPRHRLPGHHDGKHAHVRAYPGKRAHVLALLLIHGERGKHGPVGDVVHAVGDVPKYVRQAEHDHKPVVRQPEVREQDEEEHAARHRAYEHGRFVLSPWAPNVVYDQACDGVVERVEYPQHRQHHARRREHAHRQAQHVRQVVQERVRFKGIEHIPADGAEAEEIFVPLFQLCHLYLLLSA